MDLAKEPLFQTQRRRIIEAYKTANEPFSASTKPYKSTVTFNFHGVNPIVESSVIWYVAQQGQQLDWFSYKIGDAVPGNLTGAYSVPYRSASEADTNISKARTTNGAEDFVIEGMSASHRSTRGDFTGVLGISVSPENITDTNVLSCLGGNCPIYDPAALYLSPQIMSPFNLEDGMFRAMIGLISVEFEWDRSKTVKIGTLEQIPEGAANSYLRSSGEPSTNDRYRIPEGYLWRREGQPDSEFVCRGNLSEPICTPALSVLGPAVATPALISANTVHFDVVLRLHGLSVKLPTRN